MQGSEANAARPAGTPRVVAFATAIFVSAFLVFLVQPVVGKHILPWFGGVPAVWTLCLAFYQTCLFAGYAYAHALVSRVDHRRQLFVHAALFVVAVAALPVLPGAEWRPEVASDPSARIIAMLVRHVAPAFVLLAATGPLLQAWFARALPGRSPYPLYAVSNLGSLLALVAYPVLIEPALSVTSTAAAWTWGFVALGLLILAVGRASPPVSHGTDTPAHADEDAHLDPHVTPGRVALWIALPATAVVLFMGVTHELCLDVASVPFLWIGPLALYLVTLIVCFGREGAYRPVWMIALAIVSGALLLVMAGRAQGDSLAAGRSLVVQIGLHAGLLFGGCMAMHGELYRMRPPASALTLFYLCVAGGGALGGLFVGLAAPRLFPGYWELPLGAALCWGLWLAAQARARDGALRRRAGLRVLAVATTVALAAGAIGLGQAARSKTMVSQQRTFFGILRVNETDRDDPRRARRSLYSGRTQHGTQFLAPSARREPTAYYGHTTGVGLLLASRAPGAETRLGVVGLGVGTLAAYGRPGDTIRFYEIDPAVLRIASDSERFTFLSDSEAEIAHVLGDARLALEAEVARSAPRYDVLVVDAFSSDAIPVHLATREAMALYVERVGARGVVAMHVSNRHLDLVPLVMRLGAEQGLAGVVVRNPLMRETLSQRATWVLLSPDVARLNAIVARMQRRMRALGIEGGTVRFSQPTRERLAAAPIWTDDYSNLFGVLRR